MTNKRMFKKQMRKADMKKYRTHEFLYHVTYKDAVEDIMELGLEPRYGANSQKIKDERGERLYLTTEDKINEWMAYLNADAVIRIDITDMSKRSGIWGDFERTFTVDDNGEKSCNAWICPECLSEYKVKRDHELGNYQVLIASISALSNVCSSVCNSMLGRSNMSADDINSILNHCTAVNENINPVTNPWYINDLKTYLIELGEEGCYTFCDTLFDIGRTPGPKLYKVLPKFNDPETQEAREAFSNMIERLYGNITSDLYTGGMGMEYEIDGGVKGIESRFN